MGNEEFIDTVIETAWVNFIKKIVEEGEVPVEDIEEKFGYAIKELIKWGIIDYTDETRKKIKPLKKAYYVLHDL